MGFITNFLKKSAIKFYQKEVEQFIENLKVMDSDEIAFLVDFAMKTRHFFIVKEDMDLMYPFILQEKNPVVCADFGSIVRSIQRDKNFVAAASCMPWLHTLRAASFIELRGLCRTMWRELSRGMTGPTDDDFPEGFTPEPL